jgi:hypothetical protein
LSSPLLGLLYKLDAHLIETNPKSEVMNIHKGHEKYYFGHIDRANSPIRIARKYRSLMINLPSVSLHIRRSPMVKDSISTSPTPDLAHETGRIGCSAGEVNSTSIVKLAAVRKLKYSGSTSN